MTAERDSLIVAGRKRSFITVRGTTRTPQPALLLMLHGTLQTARNIRPFAGYSFDQCAVGGEAVVMYPDAIRRDWNGARKAVMVSRSTKSIDDVGFIRALIAHAIVTENVDPSRVYVAGFSLGGEMVIRLIHEMADVLAGAAVLSANMPVAENFIVAHDLRLPLPVLTIHGTADPLAPYWGGVVGFHGRLSKGLHLSALDTAHYFAARNGITGEPAITKEGATVTRLDYTAPGHPRVRFYSSEGGGHVLNNPNHQSRQWFWGPSSRDIVVADAVAEFFDLPASTEPGAA